MDKFALIYEFNKESPLIVYEASKELEKKNIQKSIELFEKASQKFPYHPTVFFLKAVADAYNNQFELSKQNLLKGDNLLNDKKTLDFYHQLIENIRLKKDDINLDLGNSQNNFFYKSVIDNHEFDNIDTEQLISNEEINSDEINFDNEPIVTETLAEIYASQENFTEALEIFEKLKIAKPELTEKFDNRIREIKTAIENKNQNKFGN
ncbi:MAG: hypothetical protein IPH62_09390 [Ignavibacteriae bacterium]|nr:hypothetical protein [Ignavibacteriota bacterium]